MKRAIVVSSQWPCTGRSGVSLVAAEHVRVLLGAGFYVSIIGSQRAVMEEDLAVASRHVVNARGSGSLYSPARIDRKTLMETLIVLRADVVIVEAWQTALTDATVEICDQLRLPTLMVSHGVSLFPASSGLSQWFRAALWAHYRYVRFPRLLKAVSRLTALDMRSKSDRFYDREAALRQGIPISLVTNCPIHVSNSRYSREKRRPQILLVGYFSRVKNQLFAISLLRDLPSEIRLRMVGRRSGRYFARCVREVRRLGLQDRVEFIEDSACDLAEEFAVSLAVLSTSVTEAMPITLLEAMAAGTPFVATPVGAIPALLGGRMACNVSEFQDELLQLICDAAHWQRLSEAGRQQIVGEFQSERVREQFLTAVNLTLNPSPAGLERV